MSEKTSPAKSKSTVRHNRAIQVDRQKRPNGCPPEAEIEAWLHEIVHPATLSQVTLFQKLELRARTLSLPVMMAFLLTLIWRQIGSVSELVRVVQREVILWAPPARVSQQALSQRLATLPASLFEAVLHDLLPGVAARWQARRRPLNRAVAWAQQHYAQVLACDGSTLDGLIRKIGLLRELPKTPLAGRMAALIAVGSRLPFRIWFDADAQAHDLHFWPRIVAALPPQTLLLFDLGFTNFANFLDLTARSVTFITRAKSNLVHRVLKTFVQHAAVRDCLVEIGEGATRQQLRLIEVEFRGTWYRYLTNELDPQRLPTEYLVALYWQRWRIEEAFAVTKRLLGLAYFHCGSSNAVQLQLWATWILYTVLLDLTDAVAEELNQPVAALSMQMLYRALYHFTQAHQQGDAPDLVAYLAANAADLGILMRKRPPKPDPLRVVRDLLALQ